MRSQKRSATRVARREAGLQSKDLAVALRIRLCREARAYPDHPATPADLRREHVRVSGRKRLHGYPALMPRLTVYSASGPLFAGMEGTPLTPAR